MRFRVLDAALADAHEIAEWYDACESGLGGDFLGALKAAWDAIRASPQSQSILETIELPPHELRRRLLQRFPYLVIFTVTADEIVVVSICHERRHPGHWVERLGD